MKKLKGKKGFTLIEILTAVIILGVVALIGISAITDYIEMSRKSAFVATANSYIEEVRSLKANNSLVQEPKNTEALLIPISEIEIDGNKSLKTPYGNIITERSYVIIENESDEFNYYIAILDDTGHAIILENDNDLDTNSIQFNSSQNDLIKEINSIKENLEYIDLNGKLYQLSNNNLENSSTVLLDCSILELFTVTVSEEWENDDKTITINTINGVEGYQYYISNKSSKPLKSDDKWQSDNKFKRDLGTYYAFVKSENGEISSGKKVIIDKIDKGTPICTLKATGEMSTEEYFGTDVVISFESYDDVILENSQTSGIKDYGIGSSTGNSFVIHAEDNIDGVTYTGYVEDKAGNIGTCSITVKRKADWTLTYNNNGGTGCTNKAVVYNNQIGTLCTPTKTGYTFEGWYKENELLNKVTSSTIFKNDFTNIYAKWTPNNYQITFNANGGNVSTTSKMITYDTVYGTLPTPTRAGYIFKGWYTSTNGGVQIKDTTIMTTAQNHTLYAQWNICQAGTYGLAGATSCTRCPTGYTSNAGATAQNQCYISVNGGKYIGSAGSPNQASCPAGKYKAAHIVYYGNTSSCSLCAAGTYSTWSAASCTRCPTGYTSNAGATAQNQCYISVNGGKYIGSAGSPNQASCPAGKYKAAHIVYYGNTSSCSLCAAGTYSTWSAASCTRCPTGYTSNAGATAQNQCYINVAAGKYIGTANSATQSSCAAGTYKGSHVVNYGSTSSCSLCAAGTYSTGGAASCSICPSGYTSSTGATSINSCYTTLTYNNNGGSGCSNKVVNYGGTYGTLCVPTRSNYAFLGWYTAASGGTQITSTSSVGRTANPTLYAHWQMLDTQKPTINSITVSGGAPNLTITVNATDDGTIASYEFSGLNNQTYKSNGTNKTYTITGAAAGGTYTVYVRVKDTTGKYRVGYVQVTSNAQEECEKFYSTCNGQPCLSKYEPQGWFYCGYYTLDIWYVFCRNCVAAGTYRITSYNYQAG